MPVSKVKKTPLKKTEKEKILYSVFKALAAQVQEETTPALNKAFSDSYAEFYTKMYGKKGGPEDKAFHVLAAKGLIETHTKPRISDLMSSQTAHAGWNAVLTDTGLSAFREATTASGTGDSGYLATRHIGWKGFCPLDDNDFVRLNRSYPEIMKDVIKNKGDQYAVLRANMVARVTQALMPYEKYAAVAVQTRAIIMGSKNVEDLKSDLPDLIDLIDSIIKKPVQLPAVISPDVTSTLKKLKPIEVQPK